MKKFTLLLIFVLSVINASSQQNWLQGAGSNANDEATDLIHDQSGSIYSTGYFSQSARFDNIIIPSSGMSDVFVAKQDSLGTFLWVVNAGGIQDDKTTAIALNTAGEIFITGVYRGTAQFGSTTLTSSSGSQDIFIAKLDNTGNFLWAQSYGGSDTDLSSDISVDANGNITTVGQFKGTSTFGGFTFTSTNYPLSMPMSGGLPSYDAFIFKTNTTGSVIWAKQGAAIYDDRILKVDVDAQSNIYICGQFSDTLTFSGTYNNNAFNAGFLMKIDSSGNEIWFKRMIATQFMIYDMKAVEGNIWLTGDFQGTLVYIGPPNNYVNSTFPYKAFALKIQASTGNFIAGTSEGSDNALSSRGIAVDEQNNVFTAGYFKCSFTSFSNIHGNGIFNSVGYRDVYVVKYDSVLTRVWEKQYGGIGDDYPTSLNIFFTNDPVFAGSYTKNFNTPDGYNFITHINNLSTNNSNFGSVICGNGLYGHFMTQKGWGNKDILIARPVNTNSPLYDYFQRISGTCMLDTLMPSRFPATDTIYGCDKVEVLAITPTTKDSLQAPDWTYSWSNGSTRDTAVFLTSGWHYINYGYSDNCRTFVDSFYVQIYLTPPTPIITTYNALMMPAIPIISCLNKAVIMSGGTATFVASNIPAGYSFLWTLPGGGTSTSDTIYASVAGVYYVTSTSPGGLCSNYSCVELLIFGSGGSCSGLSTFTPAIIFTDSIFNSTDTVRICKDDLFEMQLVENSLFLAGLPTYLYTFANWTISGGYSFQPFDSYPTTFGSHIQNFKANTSGNCSATAVILDPVSSAPVASVTRNFYLDVRQPPSNIPLISGAVYFCPGDTVTLTASGGDNYVWTGPGIVQTNSPVNDTVLVNLLGVYNLTSTTIDTVLGCTETQMTYFTLGSMPSPIVTMNPVHGTICPFDSVLLSAEAGSSYVWYGPAGAVIATTQTVWVSTPGIYYYTFISSTGCSLVSEMVEVKEYSTPYLDALPGTSLCASGTVVISVETNESSLISWGTPFSGSSAFSQIITSPGTYSVSVNFCSITTVANITITSATGTPVDIIYWGNDTICPQDTVVLIGTNGYSDYTWYPSLELGQSYVTTGPGTYFLQATNQLGCISSDSITIYSYPNVEPPIASDTTVCAGSSLTINASGSGTIFWYDDLFAGNLLTIGNSLSLTMGQNDTTFYITNSNGTCSSISVPSSVSIYNGSQVPTIIGTDHLCAGDTLILEVNNPAAGVTYTWNGPGMIPFDSTHLFVYPITSALAGNYFVTASNGFCSSQTDSITVLVNDPILQSFSSSTYYVCQYDSLALLADTLIGSYLWNNGYTGTSNYVSQAGIYYYTYTDSIGCIAQSDTTNLIVLTAPILDPIPDTSVCATTPLTFTAGNDSTLIVNWYDEEYNLISTGSSYSIISVITPTTIIVTVTDTNGCTSLADTIQINIIPPIASPLLSMNDSLCIGDTLNLTSVNLPGYTYYWTGPTGFSSNLTSPAITPVALNNSGIYNLVVINGYCASDTGSVQIYINDLPTITTSTDQAICFGDGAILSANSSIGSLTWSTGEITNVIGVMPFASTVYTVQSSNICGTVTDSIVVIVNPLPAAYAGADQTLLAGETGQLNTASGNSYIWSPSASLSCNNCSNPVFTATLSQYYFLTVTDSNGCSNSDSVYIYVRDANAFYIPNAFTPNNDGLNDQFMIKGDNISRVQMMIFDRWGEKIFESNDINIGWNGLYKGRMAESEVYVYKIKITMDIGEEHKLTGTVTLVK